MRRRRRSKRSGLLTRRNILLLLGATASGGTLIGTGAFSNATADRFVDASATDDANALLGIEGYADTATVTTFTNTTTSSVTTTLDSSEAVEFDVGETGSYELVPVTFGIGVGASVNVAIQDGGNAGSDADIDITATGDDFSFQATRNFVIPASSAVKEIKPTVTASGNSGKFEFELENTGSFTVTLTEIGVVQTTNNNVVKVGGKNNDPIFENVTTGNSIVNNVITVGGSRQPITTTVDLTPGANNAITFEFDRFRDGQDKNGTMNNDDVQIEVAFSDGSSTTLDLCIGSCDFASTPTPTSTPTDTPTTTGTATPPSNEPPTADFTSSRKGNSSNVDLDGSPSSDPDGSITSYEWDIGANGTVDQTGQTVSANVSQGTDVRLIITDNDGASASVTKTVN